MPHVANPRDGRIAAWATLCGPVASSCCLKRKSMDDELFEELRRLAHREISRLRADGRIRGGRGRKEKLRQVSRLVERAKNQNDLLNAVGILSEVLNEGR